MKIKELEEVINNLQSVKEITDRLNYNQSSMINKSLMPALNTLQTEYDRMASNKIEIDCPCIKLIKITDTSEAEDTLNYEIEQLVLNGFKIIDFGIMGTMSNMSGYIKYTN